MLGKILVSPCSINKSHKILFGLNPIHPTRMTGPVTHTIRVRGYLEITRDLRDMTHDAYLDRGLHAQRIVRPR
jgi:hypothetical protein